VTATTTSVLAVACAINAGSVVVLVWVRRERRRLQFLRYGARTRRGVPHLHLVVLGELVRRRWSRRRTSGDFIDLSTSRARERLAREPFEASTFGERPAGRETYGRW
jgi:hypothetical protein